MENLSNNQTGHCCSCSSKCIRTGPFKEDLQTFLLKAAVGMSSSLRKSLSLNLLTFC